MHDFTPEQYTELIDALSPLDCIWHIMHHIDRRPEHALAVAILEHARGIQSTYYFRSMHIKPYAGLIQSISILGHHIGYHYENLSACGGNYKKAYEDFVQNLERLRQLAPVNTACAHGSPMSKWDNQSLWNQYDIHSFGIAYEPLLDTDFSSTLYLTDTGRRWDGALVSVRDKVISHQDDWSAKGLVFHTTAQLIDALHDENHVIHRYSLLINTHPQRWLPYGVGWLNEAVSQWLKNAVKYLIVKSKY